MFNPVYNYHLPNHRQHMNIMLRVLSRHNAEIRRIIPLLRLKILVFVVLFVIHNLFLHKNTAFFTYYL